MKKTLLAFTALLALSGCDQVSQKLGLEDPTKKEARLEPEAKAVGSACRQSGRAIEDCYSIYGWLPKAGIYAGWREMDEYMRENKLDIVSPTVPSAASKAKPAPDDEAEDETEPPAAEDAADKASKSAPAPRGKAKASAGHGG